MATFLFAYLFIVSNLKFVKGFQEYYAASSGTLVQNSSCIVDNDVLHWMYLSVTIPSHLQQAMVISVYTSYMTDTLSLKI